jgi:ribosomal protein S18 acetylase RimI-like enzyme
MLVKLYDLPDSARLRQTLTDQGIVIRRAMAFDKRAVVRWIEERFSEIWASECEVAFSNLPISCYLATQSGTIAGFGCYDSTCRNFFGPTGVDEPARGRGIGSALLLACLEAMRADGYGYAIIGGVGPKEFYAKVAGAVEIPGSTPGVYRDMLKRA